MSSENQDHPQQHIQYFWEDLPVGKRIEKASRASSSNGKATSTPASAAVLQTFTRSFSASV